MSLIDLNHLGLRPATSAATTDAVAARRPELSTAPQRRDRLVELHVLAEHGDDAAAAEAREWLDLDPEARRTWDRIEELCRELRAEAAGVSPAWR